MKASSSHKGPYEFDQLLFVQDFKSEHIGPVWCMKFSACGRSVHPPEVLGTSTIGRMPYSIAVSVSVALLVTAVLLCDLHFVISKYNCTFLYFMLKWNLVVSPFTYKNASSCPDFIQFVVACCDLE